MPSVGRLLLLICYTICRTTPESNFKRRRFSRKVPTIGCPSSRIEDMIQGRTYGKFIQGVLLHALNTLRY